MVLSIMVLKDGICCITSQTTSEWHMDELAEHNLGLPFYRACVTLYAVHYAYTRDHIS